MERVGKGTPKLSVAIKNLTQSHLMGFYTLRERKKRRKFLEEKGYSKLEGEGVARCNRCNLNIVFSHCQLHLLFFFDVPSFLC